MECPWSQFEQARGNFGLCEENLCSWIVQPGNTWTNIGFLITAYLVFKNSRSQAAFEDRAFILMSIGLFIGSTVFHATLTRVGQIMDLAAIYFLSAALMAFGLKRLWQLNKTRTRWVYVISLVSPLLHMLVFQTSGIPVLAVFFATSLCIEFWLWKKGITHKVKTLLIAVAIFLVGFALWIVDISGHLCHPQNHILSAHGAWHLLSALACYQLYLFFKSEIAQEPS